MRGKPQNGATIWCQQVTLSVYYYEAWWRNSPPVLNQEAHWTEDIVFLSHLPQDYSPHVCVCYCESHESPCPSSPQLILRKTRRISIIFITFLATQFSFQISYRSRYNCAFLTTHINLAKQQNCIRIRSTL